MFTPTSFYHLWDGSGTVVLGGDILITGSATLVQSLMETDLIDEYRFLVQPILMGSGKRFFKDEMHMTKLRLVSTKTYPKGVIGLTYQPISGKMP
jgi:dihydrofolate reductase